MPHSCLLLALTILAVPVAAQTDTTRVIPLGAVEVVGERGLDRAGRVDARDVRRFDQPDVAGALSLLPGVDRSATGGRGESMVHVRGFDLRQVPVFLDGIPVYVPYDGLVDLGRFLTTGLAELRVETGDASLLYGANTLGGAINLVTRVPNRRVEVSALAGTFSGGGRRAELSVGGRFGSAAGGERRPFYVQASGALLERGTFPLAGGGSRDNAARRDLSGSVKVGRETPGGGDVAISMARIDGSKGNPSYAGTDPDQRPRFWRWPRWDKTSAYAALRQPVGAVAGVPVEVRARAYWDAFDNTLVAYDDDSFTTQTARRAFESVYDDDAWGGSAEIRLLPSPRFALALAAHTRADRHRERQANSPGAFPAPPQAFDPDLTYRDVTVGAALEGTARPTPRLRLSAGLGVDARVGLRAEELVPGGGGADVVRDLDAPDRAAPTVRFSSEWGLGSADDPFAHTARLSVSRRTRFPTVKDRYSYRLGQALPSPELDPESAIHAEAGYAGSLWDGRLQIDGAAFGAWLGDAIERVDGVAIGADGPLFQLQNVGRVRHLGVEASVRARPIRQVETGVGVALIDRRSLSDADLVLTDVPARSGHVWLDAQPLAGLSTLIRVESASHRFSTTQGAVADGFVVADALLRYALPSHLVGAARTVSIEAGMRNVFDADYTLDEGYPEPGRTLSVSLVYRDR